MISPGLAQVQIEIGKFSRMSGSSAGST
jgi:hypothetical protein